MRPVYIDGVERMPTLLEKTSAIATLAFSMMPYTIASKVLPSVFPPRHPLFAAFGNPNKPYTEIKKSMTWQAGLGGVGAAVFLAATVALTSLAVRSIRG